MRNYLDLVQKILDSGTYKPDRTGTGTISLFGEQLRFNLKDGFPLVTTKHVHLKSIIYELLWFLSGDTNIRYLNDNGVTIWDEWATEDGNLGPVYGKQWVNWNGVNQIEQLIYNLKTKPDSRRHIISAWNVEYLPDEKISPQENVKNGKMALAPCHFSFQFYVNNAELSCLVNIRSNDIALGAPYNIASYALLAMMVAQQCNFSLGELIMNIGDAHIYSNHIDGLREQLSREPFELPRMNINKRDSIFDYQYEDFTLENYQHHSKIKFDIAV